MTTDRMAHYISCNRKQWKFLGWKWYKLDVKALRGINTAMHFIKTMLMYLPGAYPIYIQKPEKKASKLLEKIHTVFFFFWYYFNIIIIIHYRGRNNYIIIVEFRIFH